MHMQAGDGHFLFEFFVSLLFENAKESTQQNHCGLSCLFEC
jgi:hypothetical protein